MPCNALGVGKQQGSSENDGRSKVYGRLKFKIVSSCCYPNCSRTNCGHFVNLGNLPKFFWTSWIYLNLPEFTPIYQILPEFIWIYLNLPQFTSIYLKLPEITWNNLKLPEVPKIIWINLILPEISWITWKYLNLPEFIWTFLNLSEFTWNYMKLHEIS